MLEGAGCYSLDVSGGVPTPLDYASAEKLLARLVSDPNPTGIAIKSAYVTLDSGTTVFAQVVGSQRRLTLVVSPSSGAPPIPVESALWIPHGFVFVPGDASAPQGYGLPVKAASGGAFATANTDPGLDTSRWTANGPCGQVYLTNRDTDNEPPRDKQLFPLAYDDSQGSPGTPSTLPLVAWHAVRARFNDFTWNPATSSARQAYWSAVMADAPAGYRLPFATHYDGAQELALLLDQYHSMAALPAWFSNITQRANKDGIPLGYGDGYGFGQPPASQLAGQLTTPATNSWPALDIGIGQSALGYTTAYQDSWIAVGNNFWYPPDDSLPILSWMGYPAMNLPGWITAAGFAPPPPSGSSWTVVPDLETATYEWRQGKNLPLYGKKLFAMGRQIGTLPETVISAGIAKVQHPDQNGKTQTYNQVRVITWNAANQPINSTTYNYWWQFNVWFVEALVDVDVPLHLADMPVGAYDATNNPSGWRKAGSFVLDSSANPLDDLLRLLSQTWRFDPTGAKAISYMAYNTSTNGSTLYTPLEVVFSNVADNALTAVVGRPAVAAASSPYFANVVALDYDGGGNFVCIYQCNYPTSATLPLPPGAQSGYPPNAPGSLAGISAEWFWSGGGGSEIVGWYGGSGIANTCPTVQLWALDARDGAFAVVSHWANDAPAGQPMPLTYYVRLCRAGQRLATDTFADATGIDDFTLGYLVALDRFKFCYARDQTYNWVFGYDFGVTTGQTYVYSGPIYSNASPPSASAATSSSWLYSHWLSSVGDPVALSNTAYATTQLFPVGVV